MTSFKIFVECQQIDGYGNTSWTEICTSGGFLDGYCNQFDGYITEELFVGLSNIKDGYFAPLFKRPLPTDISISVRYKIDMLSCLGDNKLYCLFLEEINQFDWTKQVYASFLTVTTMFAELAPDFVNCFIPILQSLGPSDQIRIIILKKG